MEIITGRKSDLLKKLEVACRQVRKLRNFEDRFEFYNYIGNLYSIINSIDDKKIPINYSKSFGSQKEYDRFLDRAHSLRGMAEQNFLKYKSFHNNYMGDILDIVTEGIDNIEVRDGQISDACFSKDDFYYIFYEFLKTMNLEDDFDHFIKNRNIFSRRKNPVIDDYDGCILINPIYCNMSVIASDFKYDLESMFLMAHEFGHVFDLKELKGAGSASKITNYTYKSLYNESISRLFEKLFIDFMLEQNIYSDAVLEKQARTVISNHDYILAAYIFSLFSAKEIENGVYADMSVDDTVELLGDSFLDRNILKLFLQVHGLSFPDDLVYSYGDVMSSFLKESIDKDGVDSKFFRDFMKIRTYEFTPEFIQEYDLSPKRYQKLYNKEIQQIKK